MNEQLTGIRDQQKASWNKFSPGWKKWDQLTMDFLRPMGDEIIRSIAPQGKDQVLDIAGGTGEPGLTIASMIPEGKVVITDLAEDMIAIARENAERKKLGNVETMACDVSELPFPDESFDAISCRMGFMFFPDMQLAANEMYRVLKKGGRIATSVWDGPDQNYWVTAIMSTIKKHIETPDPPPGSPGMFRCSAPGLMNSIFEKAGFKKISEKKVSSQLDVKSGETYWNFMTEVAAPIVAALSKADDVTIATIRKELLEKLPEKYTGEVHIDTGAIVISALK
jgi:ubiquinone/menaquinone biosynthesis C-methylase UbiE